MCGRYAAFTDADYTEMGNIVREVEKNLSGNVQLTTGEVYPTNLAPVLISGRNSIQAAPMVWGFPRWAGGGVVINARAETAADKQMFRDALFSRRLVVPSTGFYEWKRIDGKKQKDKYLIRQPDSPMLYMAGLYSFFKQPDDTQSARFVILTTAANESMASLHDRMPVILGAEEIGRWLSGGDGMGAILSRIGPALLLKHVS